MGAIERFEMNLRGVAGVQSVVSVPSLAKVMIGAFNEGNPRWGGAAAQRRRLEPGARPSIPTTA
ncbi:hypothetical protein ACU4GD_05575 [Cupriavidus basilensis]